MTTSNFQSDDPRLTAYALGELDHAGRVEVEAMLAESAEARMSLEGIRETIALLRGELSFQPALTLTDLQRETVTQALVAVDTSEPTRGAGWIPASETRANLKTGGSGKTSRWVVIGRAAATVAAVGAVAVAVPYLSRVGSSDRSASESLVVSASPDEDESMLRDEARRMSGSTAPDRMGDSVSMDRKSREVEISTESQSQSSASTAESRPGEATAAESISVVESGASSTDSVIVLSGKKDAQHLQNPGILVLDGNESGVEETEQLVAQLEGQSGGQKTESEGKPGLNDALAFNNPADDPQTRPSSDLLPQFAEGDPERDREAEHSGEAGKAAGPTSSRDQADAVSEKKEQLAQANAPGDSKPSSVKSNEKAVSTDSTQPINLNELSRGKSDSWKLNSDLATEALPEAKDSTDRLLAGRSRGVGRTSGGDLPSFRQGAFEIDGRGGELNRPEEPADFSKIGSFRRRGVIEAALGAEAYDAIIENAFTTPMEQPLSTFSIDVDTASYANTRRFIQQGQLPPRNAVRIEELVNYFRYDYPEPADGSPFSVSLDVATCPWNPHHKLARVGLKARTIAEDKRPATNLVFLIDVSGSMAAENKLPLVKQALSVLVSKMGEDDQIAIVTYAGEAGLKLNSTSGSQRNVIQQAIDSLSSGGSTNGAAGIQIAYDTAIRSFIKGGANRVILCTDGDFNVGVSDDNTLVEIIQEKAASGVFLSVFGFGMGNLKDAKLEKLADKGNGNYGYIDGLQEARKVFGEQLSGTLITVAKDVKLQLEFSNSTVGAYRLIGYENRVLAAKDFDDDTKDAGEIGAGHTVTALYEIVPKAVWLTQVGLNPEKFDIVEKNVENKDEADGRLFTVKMRHKLPDAETSERSIDFAAMDSDIQLSDSNVDFRFAAAVASFGMQIRDSKFCGQWTLQNVLSTAEASLSEDRNGERTEFTDLIRGVMRIRGESIYDPRLTSQPAAEIPTDLPVELSAGDARIKATVGGKYRRLLKKIEVRSDVATYGDFRDFGHWEGTSYSGHSDLPTGHWVWVYPNWYIWGDKAEEPSSELETEPEGKTSTPSQSDAP